MILVTLEAQKQYIRAMKALKKAFLNKKLILHLMIPEHHQMIQDTIKER